MLSNPVRVKHYFILATVYMADGTTIRIHEVVAVEQPEDKTLLDRAFYLAAKMSKIGTDLIECYSVEQFNNVEL